MAILMDFILLPDGAEHLSVPDLGGPDYDNQGFDGYPERQGWNLTYLIGGDLQACNDWSQHPQAAPTNPAIAQSEDPHLQEHFMLATAVAFVQTWILFGIFQEALGRPVTRAEISKVVPIAAAGAMPPAIREIALQRTFAEFVGIIDGNPDSKWQLNLAACLRTAAIVLLKTEQWCETADLDYGNHMLLRAHLHLSTLIESINFQVIASATVPVYHFVRTHQQQESNRKRLSHRKWCSNLIHRVGRLGVEVSYYASLMPGFGIDMRDHGSCESDVCVASNIKHDIYRVSHAENYCPCHEEDCDHTQLSCRCSRLLVPAATLEAALSGDSGFPLVRFQEGKIDIVQFEPGTAYIAISHVWSDGRGNPNGNALPRCQLEAIHRYVADLPIVKTESLFWIDTLCVPVQEPSRNTAVMRMVQVYSSASHVLVLSNDLLSINAPSTPDEAFFRISFSQWTTRLWTMQEGILSRSLVFQFRDKAVFHSILNEEMEMDARNLRTLSRGSGEHALEMLGWISNLRELFEQGDHIFIYELLNSINGRSTSRISDVAVCGATLSGYGLDEVLSVPNDNKMRVFWLGRRRVPTTILWAPGPRLNADGVGWAPKDPFNAPLPEDSDYGIVSAEPTTAGLLLEGVEAIVLDNVPLPMNEYTVFRFSLPGTREPCFCDIGIYINTPDGSWEELGELWNDQCVLLLPLLWKEIPVCSAALTIPAQVMGSDQAEILSPISTRYLACVTLVREEDASIWTSFDEAVEKGALEMLDILADSRSIDSSRRWCVF